MKQDRLNTSAGKPILIIDSFEFTKTVSLNSNVFSIGRHPQCSLVINDPLISRHHATIVWLREEGKSEKYAHWIIDGKGQKHRSKNGILVNGQKTFLHRLCPQDVVTFIVNSGNHTSITYSLVTDTTENSQISQIVYYL